MIKKLAKHVGEYKKDAVLSPVFVAIEVVLDVLIPMLMAWLLDRGIEKQNMNAVWFYGACLLVAALLSLLTGVLSGKHAARASAGFSKNLRKSMFHNIQGFSFSNIDKFSSASIVTRLTSDVTNVCMAFQMIIRVAVRAPLMLVFSLAMGFTVNVKLALIFLVTVPIVAGALLLIMLKAHPVFVRVFKTYDKLNSDVQENLAGARVVKSFVRADYEKKKFGKVSKSIYDDFSRAERIVSFNNPVMQFSVYVTILLICWLGAKTIVVGGMETGQLTAMFAYATQILMSLMMLSMVLVMIIMARTSAERIVELLDEESDMKLSENPITEVKSGDVTFENVTFRYKAEAERDSLKEVNLEIKSGETVGILGGTGSSKSTLVQLIPRLYDVTQGSVKVGGADVRDYDLTVLRDSVAMVLQKNLLFSGTIKENLRWGNENATDEELERACVLACADDFIRAFPEGYDTYIEQGGTNVSGGQKQRLCIARALLKKPKILILDDSTSAVDTKTDAMIRKAFKEEIPDTTKFIIAQRVSSVEDADKIIVMEDGGIIAMGTHEELLNSSEVYREIYESQRKGSDEPAQADE